MGKSRSRSRSRDRDRKRENKERKRSRSRERKRSRSRERKRSRSRDREPRRERDSKRDRSRERDRKDDKKEYSARGYDFPVFIDFHDYSSHEKDFAKRGKEGESLRRTKRKNPIVWMEVVAKQKVAPYAETALGKVVILLRKDVVPKTAENFLQLCTHKKGKIS